jgi:hypothetical protein
MTKFIIKDWMGNILWDGKEFDSFMEGWEFIYEADPEPEKDSPDWVDGWYDDYYVEEKEAQ